MGRPKKKYHYLVTETRYFGDVLYEPDGKRTVITVDEPFDPMPRGVIEVDNAQGVIEPSKGRSPMADEVKKVKSIKEVKGKTSPKKKPVAKKAPAKKKPVAKKRIDQEVI